MHSMTYVSILYRIYTYHVQYELEIGLGNVMVGYGKNGQPKGWAAVFFSFRFVSLMY